MSTKKGGNTKYMDFAETNIITILRQLHPSLKTSKYLYSQLTPNYSDNDNCL